VRQRDSLKLTAQEIQRAFEHHVWAEKFPPVLSVAQAAELAQVPIGTLYTWSSQGRLQSCAARAGKHLRIWRDGFIETIFNQGIQGDQ
jgi:hypothetical protein